MAAKLVFERGEHGYWLSQDLPGVRRWVIEINDAGRFMVGRERFTQIDDAVAWCQSQEDAAAPVELPKPGEVWGVPGKPETWRRVMGVPCGVVQYFPLQIRSGFMSDSSDEWQSWLRESGAVRIDGEERVRELEGEVARLRERIGTAAKVNYDLRAANARLLEALREIAELAADISYPDHAIRDMVDTKAREAAMLKVVGVETLEQANALGDKPRVAALEAEVARLRAASARLMEALRGIESDADAALSGVAFVVKLTNMRDRAREARIEEGVKS